MIENPSVRPYISEENQLQCSEHSLPITKILVDSSNGLVFLCSECLDTHNGITRDPIINADKQHQFYTLSLSDLSASILNRNPENVKNEVMEFRTLEIEHIIVDQKSQGYSPRNLAYVPDKNLLVACSSNGHISIWSIGEVVQWRSEFNIEKPIGFAKYIDRGDCGSNYLFLGAGTEVHVYEIVEDCLSFVSVLNRELNAFDLEWIPQSDTIVIAGEGNSIQIWDLKTFSLERAIDVEASGSIYRVIYLSHRNALALESMTGVSLISLEKEGLETEGLPKHFHISDRTILGLAYLPKSRCFMLRGNCQIEVIDEDSFTARERKFTYPTRTSSSRLLDSQMLINEDESQCMTSNPPNRLFIYFQDATFHIVTAYKLVTENFALEMIRDQHRVVMGDQDSGTIYVLRTNAEVSSRKKIPGIPYPMNHLYSQYHNTYLPPAPIIATRQAPKKRTQTETSKDQLKQRVAKKNQGKTKKTTAKTQKGSKDGAMEIEKSKMDQVEAVSRRQTRSQTRKEQEKQKKKETKPKTKGMRGKSKEKKQEEKTRERSKSRKGKKK